MVEPTDDGHMTWTSLYPDFNNGAYIRATYGQCNVLGKKVKVRSKLPKMIIPGDEISKSLRLRKKNPSKILMWQGDMGLSTSE